MYLSLVSSAISLTILFSVQSYTLFLKLSPNRAKFLHYLYNKPYFAENNTTVYTINATKIAQEIGLGNRTNTILQSAFFRITEVIPVELAVEKMKAAALKSYGAKGQDVVDKNYAAIDRGGEYVQLTVKPEWARSAQRDASLVEEPACRRGEAG